MANDASKIGTNIQFKRKTTPETGEGSVQLSSIDLAPGEPLLVKANNELRIGEGRSNNSTLVLSPAKLVVTDSADNTHITDAEADNGDVYIKHVEDNGVVKSKHKITGTNGISVISDASGNITIDSNYKLSENILNNTVTLNLAGEHGSKSTESSVTFSGSDNLSITQDGDNIKLNGTYALAEDSGKIQLRNNSESTNDVSEVVVASGDEQGQIKVGNTPINIKDLQSTSTPKFKTIEITGAKGGDTSEGAIVVGNKKGIGTDPEFKTEHSFWEFWNIQLNTTEGRIYPCCFVPGSNGLQSIGTSDKRVRNIHAAGTIYGESFVATSDSRLKENVIPYQSLNSILDLPVYKFDFINNGRKNNIGCLAQDLKKICPEIVHEDKDGYLSIEESKIVYLLLNEVKQLRNELDELRAGNRYGKL